jgi:hypothetical protein
MTLQVTLIVPRLFVAYMTITPCADDNADKFHGTTAMPIRKAQNALILKATMRLLEAA